MAEVITMPLDSLDRNEKPAEDPPRSPSPAAAALEPPPPAPAKRRERDERDSERPPPRRGDYGDREWSPPPIRGRERDSKRRDSFSPPPPYRDRRHSPPPRRSPPPYKRSRRDEGGYDGRRGSPGAATEGSVLVIGDLDIMMVLETTVRSEEGQGMMKGHMDGILDVHRVATDLQIGIQTVVLSVQGVHKGLMSYKQFIQELEDDILPSEAERRYEEYKSEYISTQKRTYFNAHKDEEWLKDKYHPTNLLAVIERRNERARKVAKDFVLDLQNGILDLGPAFSAPDSNKVGQTSDHNSEDEGDAKGKRMRRGKTPTREADLSSAPKAHPISSEPKRVQLDVDQTLALVRKLDSEKGIQDNILCGCDNDKSSSSGPVIIVRGLNSVKGLEGTELLDTLLTYLWRIHGVDYYGMVEISEPKGFRHVRVEGKDVNVTNTATEWEKKVDSRWQERLRSQDLLEIMTAKEKIDSAAVEGLDPFIRKIRDEKYGWKYGCGAKGCTKLFHVSEFVQKHLKLKHPEITMDLTVKVREDLYFQNYMNDADAPGGTPVMQLSGQRDRFQRRRFGADTRLKDDRNNRRERDNRSNAGENFDRSENAQQGGGPEDGNPDEAMYDSLGGEGLCVTPAFPSDIAPLLMPVPGAGPLGPFVPAPPDVAMRMFREQGGTPFEGALRNGRPGAHGPAPILALSSALSQDPRRIRSYQDLDAPEDEVTVIDYRSL